MHHEKLEKYRLEQLNGKSIMALQQAMTKGELTSEEIVLMYKENISLSSKRINAVLEINPEAIQIARAMDFERQQNKVRSPLHGIPVLLKDNMDTADKMHTSAGSLALKNHYALRDAKVAERLRSAGAVILGKANMTEWANFMSDKMDNGFSSRGGQVNNPYGAFDVGGSSSGSAAAVAANLVAAAIGTETSGSIIDPASQNSIVGIKPTIGLVSRSGIIPISQTQDTAGPLARSVEDAVIVLAQLIAHDPEDPVTICAEHFKAYDWTKHFIKDGLRGVKLGVPRNLFQDQLPSEQLELFNEALDKLKQCGAQIIDDVDLGITQEDLGFAVLVHEFKSGINHYLAKTSIENPVRNLQDVIAFNQAHAAETLQYGQNLFEEAASTSGTLTEREYVEALERNRFLAGNHGISATLEKTGADALLLPKAYGGNVGAAAGFPSITVPFSFTSENEPFSITFMGKAFSEPQLVEYAYAFEQFVQGRKEP